MENCIIFNYEKNSLLRDWVELIEGIKTSNENLDARRIKGLRDLISFATDFGFSGDIFKSLICFFLITDENTYTLSAERNATIEDSIFTLALNEMDFYRELFFSDVAPIEKVLGVTPGTITDFKNERPGKLVNEKVSGIITAVRDKLSESKDTKEFFQILCGFYEKYGVGSVAMHRAFRIRKNGDLIPIKNIANVEFSNLYGIEEQKEELIENTKRFIEGKGALNTLLYGDSGTGKSSSIKALSSMFYEDGLRIVEVYKHELKYLNNLLGKLKDRNYRFIVYMDDLSFEENETEYKYLKALIEGGLEKRPENVLIYASSNRRHLIRETHGDRNEDINVRDTLQEKTSLFARFGLSIFFGAPDKNTYQHIILKLKERYKITLSDEELLKKANEWELYHSGRSGRSAEQLMEYLS